MHQRTKEKYSVTRLFCFRFFHGSSSLKPLKITLGHLQFFWNVLELFTSQGAPPVSTVSCHSMTPAANFSTGTAGVVDTSGKLWEQHQTADPLKWTCWKKFIYMLTVPHKGVKNSNNFSQWAFFHFLPLSKTTVVHRPREVNISESFLKKKFKRPWWSDDILRGLRETETWKNLKSKISWIYPFKFTVYIIPFVQKSFD